MSLDSIIKDDYGQEVLLTFIDVDTDAAADISAYTTSQKMIFTDPSGASAEKTAAFDTDGSDGVIAYTLVNGDIDEAGSWKIRGRVTSGTAVLTTEEASFFVHE
jgi:hypothetical protein